MNIKKKIKKNLNLFRKTIIRKNIQKRDTVEQIEIKIFIK